MVHCQWQSCFPAGVHVARSTSAGQGSVSCQPLFTYYTMQVCNTKFHSSLRLLFSAGRYFRIFASHFLRCKTSDGSRHDREKVCCFCKCCDANIAISGYVSVDAVTAVWSGVLLPLIGGAADQMTTLEPQQCRLHCNNGGGTDGSQHCQHWVNTEQVLNANSGSILTLRY